MEPGFLLQGALGRTVKDKSGKKKSLYEPLSLPSFSVVA